MKKQLSAVPAAVTDPTLRTAEFTFDGVTYTLCLDYRSLGMAEAGLRHGGQDVNLLRALPALTLSSLLVVFHAAMFRFHGDVVCADLETRFELTDIDRLIDILSGVWIGAMPDPETGGNPQKATS